MSLFTRANAYAPLTPLERAFLKLLWGLGATALIAMLPILAQALAQQSVDWGVVLRTALAAGGVAISLALLKLVKAYRDPLLPASMQVGQQQPSETHQQASASNQQATSAAGQ